MADERRRSPRIVADVPARLTVGPETFDGLLHDVCRDAALVESDRELALGTEVALETVLPRVAGTVRATGRVIRIAGYGDGRHSVAILFDELEAASRMRVDLFVSELEP
jgi:PilZ domain